MDKKIVPRFAVIANSLDEKDVVIFSQCLGVFDNWNEAVGCAYSGISNQIEGVSTEYEKISTIQMMENEVDFCISYEYKEKNGSVFEGYVAIHDNRSNLARTEEKKVRHGEWEFAGDGVVECTRCSETYHSRYVMPRNYCPNCGAKMDGGKQNEENVQELQLWSCLCKGR